ncbi:hypothetical protein BJX63DRAFT_431650 [Aspergillus granulosus]|uniref:Uncharacterized protein n=1 Tax=Aspergillus granulosus TaxID=176169 RepID=A0ABR4HFT7_9EURO
MSRAERVILRVPENDMNYQNSREFVDFYFTKFPSEAAPDPTRHFVHYQPPNDIPRPNPKVHIVIDLEIPDFTGNLDKDFPHEIYAVRRRIDKLEMYGYPEPTKQNLLWKVREFSDQFYPWRRSSGYQKGQSK